jgi:MFS family permease
LAIGQAYAFSVFKIPMSKLIGITQYVADGPVDLKAVPRAAGDWAETTIAWIFSLAIVFLGLSAAVFGTWLERAGPRKAMFTSACCFAGGFFVSALGVWLHQIVLVYLGYGVLGGIGLGIGYISPVSTLIKWFPDRPGMATGLAIMGFGGGAMIGSPLAVELMKVFSPRSPNGVLPTLVVMGALYFVFMMFGVFTVRVPAEGWKPAGFVPKAKEGGMITAHGVTAAKAILTPQFYLLWMVLFLNVTAGIGILENASAFIQQVFPVRVTAVAAGGFVGLLSIFNMGGRFLWSSFSDYLGRKMTYMAFFVLGPIMFALIPTASRMGSIPLFVILCGVIISMYGGGFATVPAYLRDLFGTLQVGAIHGRLLTAWSAAGIAGPALVNYIRDYQKGHGVAEGQAYNTTMYIMAGLLVVGFVCNLLVRPVDERFHADRAAGGAGSAGAPGAKVAVR